MKGDFTRFTFRPEKHYRDVRMQQGRVQLDADWNEQAEIQAYLRQHLVRDAIGPSGTPKTEDAFRVEVLTQDGGVLLTLSPGRYYVGGHLCELEATPVAVRAFVNAQTLTPETLTVDGRKFVAGGWVRVYDETDERIVQVSAVGAANLVLDTEENLPAVFGGVAGLWLQRVATHARQPYLPLPVDELLDLNEATRYVVYLRTWQRHVTALEDAALREEALGGADTTTRTQRVWQVRHAPTQATSCEELGEGWPSEGPISTGALVARAQPDSVSEELCILPARGGYRRLENQLYRVEVHAGGTLGSGTPTFKWSRDNGTVVTRLLEIDGEVLRVADTGRDVLTGFAPGQWVEVSDENRVLNGVPGILRRIASVNGNEVTLESDLGSTFTPQAVLTTLRRWEGTAPIETGGYLDLEDGVQVGFSGGTYVTGDYWVIPARTASGNVHWPNDIDTGIPLFVPPQGAGVQVAPLAILAYDGLQFQALDCRPQFPSLTTLTAEDVAYDNTLCQLDGVTTVQEAIDTLCRRQDGSCTLTLLPGPDWADSLRLIPDGSDARICFQTGVYPVVEPIVLRNKGYLHVSGAGRGTRLVGFRAEAALVFEDCAGVSVHDLYAETGWVGDDRSNARFLNGTLTFRRCPSVEVEGVTLKCGPGPERGAACLTVEQALPTDSGDVEAGTVRVRHCDLRAGHQQVGILLINVTRSQVEDNLIRVGRLPGRFSLEHLLQNRHYRGGVQRLLISNGQLNVDDEDLVGGAPAGMALVSFGNYLILFETDPSLENTWQILVDTNPPLGVQSARDLYLYLNNMASRMLANRGRLTVRGRRFSGFEDWYERLQNSNTSVASQGIVVGGRLARDVRVLNNTVLGFLQGIHLGLDDNTNTAEQLGTVRVAGNTVGVILGPYLRSRHGLFVGNCNNLSVEDNDIRVRRLPVTQRVRVEGVRVFGLLGRKMLVRRNYVANSTVGVRVTPTNQARRIGNPQWFVNDNVITALPSGGTPIEAPASVRGQDENYD